VPIESTNVTVHFVKEPTRRKNNCSVTTTGHHATLIVMKKLRNPACGLSRLRVIIVYESLKDRIFVRKTTN
ncbi:uncharacterized protein METZ01_LOCUS360423, partial [marine metagenome]